MTLYKPEITVLGAVPGWSPIQELEKEVSVYAASPQFVAKHCGNIAVGIMRAVGPDWYEECADLGMLPNIDVRVHRLNEGEYPAVPGWHCDGCLRETYFAAPDMENIPVRRTVLCTVSSGDQNGISNFEVLPIPVESKAESWGDLDKEVTEGYDGYVTNSVDGTIYEIGETTIHRCTPATTRGWRLFFRMSMWHNDYLGDGGMIAKQQQVYVPLGQGW